MATVINRSTRELRQSVNTPDYPPSEWIVNPTVPACDPKYWVIDGDTVREMTDAEKLPTRKQERLAELAAWFASTLAEGLTVSGVRLAASEAAQNKWNRTLAGFATLGLADSQACPYWDADGVRHDSTVGEIKQLVAGLTAAIVQLEAVTYPTYEQHIAEAADLATLDAIQFEVQ
jgi:hypothetical protein